jgi:acyl-CoA thioesterase
MTLTPEQKAEQIVRKQMYSLDSFSKWLGIEIISISPGHCIASCTIRPDMLNGFKICHGGVTFSIADSAFAFASNSHGIQSVSIETSILHTKAVSEGDVITAIATEKNLTNKLGIYEVILTNQDHVIVAIFKGTVFRTGREWAL